MSEQPSHDDLIGAFLDEELSEKDIDTLLKQLECQDMRARACRQSLIGPLMVERRTVVGDVSSAVRDVIAREPLVPAATGKVVPLARRSRGQTDWKVPAAGLALAASMAIAAVLVVKPAAVPDGQPAAGRAEAQEAAGGTQLAAKSTTDPDGAAPRELVIEAPRESRPIVAQWGSADAGTRTASTPAALREQLNAYLLSHARNGGGTALSGSLGYARVAASPQQQSEETSR